MFEIWNMYLKCSFKKYSWKLMMGKKSYKHSCKKDILAIKWKIKSSWTQISINEGKLWKQILEFNLMLKDCD